MWIKIKKIKKYASAFINYALILLPVYFIDSTNWSWNFYFLTVVIMTYITYILECLLLRQFNKRYNKK